jgi:hypothetical protein
MSKRTKKIILAAGIFALALVSVWFFHFKKTSMIVFAQSGSSFPCIISDPIVGHKLKPECKETAHRLGKETFIRINAAGIRGAEIEPRKKNTTRVLLLGTSGLFGIGTEEAATVSEKLELILNKQHQNKVEVLNGGIEGYFITQHYLRFAEMLSETNPQAVVMILNPESGFFKDFVLNEFCKKSPDGLPASCSINPTENLPKIFSKFAENSPKAFFLFYTAQMFLKRIFLSNKLSFMEKGKRIDFILDSPLKILLRMKAMSEARGVNFSVFLPIAGITNSIYVGGYINRPLATLLYQLEAPLGLEEDGALVAEKIKQAGIPVLGRTPEKLNVWKKEKFNSFAYIGDYHANAEGDDFLANWIADELRLNLIKK